MIRSALAFSFSCFAMACAEDASPWKAVDDDPNSDADRDDDAGGDGDDTLDDPQGDGDACHDCGTKPESPQPGDVYCMPGHYRGFTEIEYWSSANSPWPGVIGPLEGKADKANTEFDLVKNSDGEFFTIGNGCFVSEGNDDPNLKPPRSQLTGQLDCVTGKLTGTIRGYYGVKDSTGNFVYYFFKGPAEATFDPKTGSFVMGTYDVREPKPALTLGEAPGGKGIWGGTLHVEEPVSDNVADCLQGMPFPEDMFK